MDFDDTPEEAEFRAAARAFLDEHAPRRAATQAGPALHQQAGDEADAEHVRRCQAWQRTLFDNGWAGITWPAAHGGRGGTGTQAAIFEQEQSAFDVSTGVFSVSIGMVGPTLIAHGTDEQKARYLAPMLRGDEIWCQLFSEPDAGSDLASLTTRAELDGDEWVVNGQKVWTSGAHHSHWAILLVRTDPTAPKRKGITFLLVDMATPGIEVRPLRQINGAAHFNEVFLNDVRVPVANQVGATNDGWSVARTTLTSERTLIGGGGSMAGGVEEVRDLARRCGRAGDPVVRQELADHYVRTQIIRYLGLRVRTAISQGRAPGAESSVMKLAFSQHAARSADLVVGLLGAGGTLADDDAVDGGRWQQQFLGQWSVRLGGGTDQIQRNIIGERVLGLPREPVGPGGS